MKYKMTLSKFWENKNKAKMCIHCNEEIKAKMLLNAFDYLGQKWSDFKSYTSITHWEVYKELTCYSNDNGYCNLYFAERYNYKIYEFEEVDLKN